MLCRIVPPAFAEYIIINETKVLRNKRISKINTCIYTHGFAGRCFGIIAYTRGARLVYNIHTHTHIIITWTGHVRAHVLPQRLMVMSIHTTYNNIKYSIVYIIIMLIIRTCVDSEQFIFDYNNIITIYPNISCTELYCCYCDVRIAANITVHA
jgi:hypothetical protein